LADYLAGPASSLRASFFDFFYFDTVVLNPFSEDRIPGNGRQVGPMRISAVWHLAALVALAALMAMTGTAHSSEIANLYSSIDSADVTLEGDVAGMALRLDLMDEGKLIATRNLTLDGAGTFVIRWPALKAEKGSYDVCALLWENGTAISRKCNSFFYGGVEPIRFDVRDFRADSRGMHLAISASDPTVVDIYYMLIDGNRAVCHQRAGDTHHGKQWPANYQGLCLETDPGKRTRVCGPREDCGAESQPNKVLHEFLFGCG
jgi:hypothetical protein